MHHIPGKLRAIGVSNYTAGHLRELLSYCSVRPAVLQVECHPYLVQRELLNLCQDEGVHFQAYSSLGSDGNKVKNGRPAKVNNHVSQPTTRHKTRAGVSYKSNCNGLHL